MVGLESHLRAVEGCKEKGQFMLQGELLSAQDGGDVSCFDRLCGMGISLAKGGGWLQRIEFELTQK